MRRIYLDHAATTPIDKRVAQAMRDFESGYFGNPNSTHREGQAARALIDMARETIAKFINAQSQEIIFTSGATEANNHAIQGVVAHSINNSSIKPHVITTMLEHQSVYNLVKELEKRGVIEATFIKPVGGKILPEDVIREIKDNTALISVIFVSNEIGTIVDVREIGKLITDVNKRQKNRILFHIDAVQATKFFNCNVDKLACDLMTLSAHKIYGPKGIGALYIKTGTKLNNLLYGGSQEYGRRPGTQNSVGIIGMARAIELLGNLEERQATGLRLAGLQQQLIKEISKIENSELNGDAVERTPDNVNFTIYNMDQDALMTALDLSGIAASTGSACVSGSSEPSHVIAALRQGNRQAATVRFTLGRSTNASDIVHTIKIMNKLISQLRV